MAFAHARPPSAAAGSSPADGPRGASACPPDEPGISSDFRGHAIADVEPAASGNVVRLKRRSEFLAVAATGRRWVASAFVLQVGPRAVGHPSAHADIGLGFTATRRLGNAVKRNRAKRRLREAARQLAPLAAAPGHDYVLVARAEVLTCAFRTLLDDLEKAFARVHAMKPRPPQPRGSKRRQQPARRPSQPAS